MSQYREEGVAATIPRMPPTVLARPEDLQPGQADVICLFPQWFVPRQWKLPRGAVFCGFWFSQTDQELPADLLTFLDAQASRPIVFDFSRRARGFERLMNVVQRRVTALKRPVVVIVPAGVTIKPDDRTIFVCSDVGMKQLAARSCVVVHDGDSSTSAACLAAGVPQLIIGRGRWAKLIGLRLRELGVGRVLAKAMARPRVLVSLLRRLIEDREMARHCAALADEIRRQDSARELRRAKGQETIPPTVSMSLIGRFGQFGNQVLQYAFFKTVAQNNGYETQCTPWSGEDIFGYRDARLTRILPPAVEKTEGPNLLDAYPELLRYVEHQAQAKAIRIGPEALGSCPPNVDLCGHFMFHTSVLAPHKEFVRSLFVPMDDVKRPLDEAVARLRERGETIIGIQVRRGDFLASPISTFTFAVPAKWWKEWIRREWDRAKKPVLYVASDDPEFVLQELAEFSPVTAKDLDVALPARAAEQKFFVDHYVLSECDAVAISNSTFGFTACMLNTRGRTFARASLTAVEHFAAFDPWNAEPLLHFGNKPTRKTLWQIASTTYRTQGLGQTVKCFGYYLPKAIVHGAVVRAYFAQQAQGFGGAMKSLGKTIVAPLS